MLVQHKVIVLKSTCEYFILALQVKNKQPNKRKYTDIYRYSSTVVGVGEHIFRFTVAFTTISFNSFLLDRTGKPTLLLRCCYSYL